LSELVTPQPAKAISLPAVPAGLAARLRAWAPLVLVLATFITVSTVYNVSVPLYEAPDEIAHAHYVKVIAEDGELPRFESVREYEAWQPPLYYAAGAAILKLFSLDSPPRLAWNPKFGPETENFVHTAREDYPYSGPVLSVHVLRGLTTLFSAGAIIFIYLTALLIFPERRLLALCAAATASLVPQFAFMSASVNNDAPAVLFAAGTVYFGLRSLRDDRNIWVVLAAVMLSLGALTKLSILAVAVVPVAAVLLQGGPWWRKPFRLWVLAAIPLLAAGWFYLRSMELWGTVYPANLFWPQQPLPIWDEAYLTVLPEDLTESFWYMGGPMLLRISEPIYLALDAIVGLALVGVIVAFIRSEWTSFQRRSLMLLALLPFIAIAMVLYFSVAYHFQGQGRYLFAAMPAFAVLVPLGIGALFSRDRDSPAMLLMPLLLLAVNVSILTTTLPQNY
jgi:hypothetical protein